MLVNIQQLLREGGNQLKMFRHTKMRLIHTFAMTSEFRSNSYRNQRNLVKKRQREEKNEFNNNGTINL